MINKKINLSFTDNLPKGNKYYTAFSTLDSN